MSDNHVGQRPPQPVIGKSIATQKEFYYSSINEAAEDGFNACGISMCLKGKYKQSCGFEWRRWE